MGMVAHMGWLYLRKFTKKLFLQTLACICVSVSFYYLAFYYLEPRCRTTMPEWTKEGMGISSGNQCRPNWDKLGRWVLCEIQKCVCFKGGLILVLGSVREDLSAFSLLKNSPFQLIFGLKNTIIFRNMQTLRIQK